jgi:geranylgeranylglycerol-phosphate geranylgeranyltransferase
MSKFLSYVELLRAWNCAVVFFGVLAGASLSLLRIPFHPSVYLAASSAFLITGAGNSLNDYYDFEIDRVNKPSRVLPSGRIRRRNAVYLALSFFIAGVLISTFINLSCFLIACINSSLLIIYAKYSKRMLFLANLIVSYLVASVFIYGAFSAGGGSMLLLIIFICAFLVALSLEITKDIEDMKGDLSAGARTLPLVIGEGKSRIISISSSSVAIILSPFPFFLGLSYVYLLLVLLADCIFIFSHFSTPSKGRKLISLGMGIVLLGILGSV